MHVEPSWYYRTQPADFARAALEFVAIRRMTFSLPLLVKGSVSVVRVDGGMTAMTG